MIEKYLKEILAAEEKAKKIEEDARKEAAKILASANKKAEELLAQAEERANKRLSELRAQAEAEGKAQAAKLEAEQQKLLQGLKERYKSLHEEIVKEANLDLASILTLAKE